MDPEKSGFTFDGWYTQINGGGTRFLADTAVTGDVTVYARWLNAGTPWTARTLPSSADWYSVTYVNGVFVAVASGSSTAATSP